VKVVSEYCRDRLVATCMRWLAEQPAIVKENMTITIGDVATASTISLYTDGRLYNDDTLRVDGLLGCDCDKEVIHNLFRIICEEMKLADLEYRVGADEGYYIKNLDW
jgi:hypothetical protein